MYKNITTDIFAGALESLVDGMSAAELLAIPGVYEILSEELNNDVLRSLTSDNQDDE